MSTFVPTPCADNLLRVMLLGVDPSDLAVNMFNDKANFVGILQHAIDQLREAQFTLQTHEQVDILNSNVPFNNKILSTWPATAIMAEFAMKVYGVDLSEAANAEDEAAAIKRAMMENCKTEGFPPPDIDKIYDSNIGDMLRFYTLGFPIEKVTPLVFIGLALHITRLHLQYGLKYT